MFSTTFVFTQFILTANVLTVMDETTNNVTLFPILPVMFCGLLDSTIVNIVIVNQLYWVNTVSHGVMVFKGLVKRTLSIKLQLSFQKYKKFGYMNMFVHHIKHFKSSGQHRGDAWFSRSKCSSRKRKVRILAATDLSSGSSTVKRLAIRLRVTGPRRWPL